jgi:hypothetical protein
MEKVVLEIHEDVIAALKRIKTLKNGEIELVIPEGSVLLENNLNLKLLRKEVEDLGRSITFTTSDEIGQNLLDMLEGGEEGKPADFVSREVPLDSIAGKGKKMRMGISLPKLSFIKNIRNIRLPSALFKSKAPLIVGLVVLLVLVGYGAYQYWWRVPKAEITVVVNSQPLIKSVEIQVKPGVENNVEDKILAGVILEGPVTDSKTAETTGEKLVGEKAEGRIKISNGTDSDMAFEDGEELYSVEDDDMFYVLKDDITVPAAITEGSFPADELTIAGTAEVDVIAVDIGKDYNLDEGGTLEFDDYSSSDYVAEVVEDIDGGSSDVVNVASQTDLDTLSEELFTQIEERGADTVKEGLAEGQVYINGSVVSALVTEEFSAELEEEVDEVELTQTVSFRGLAYNENDLNEILEDLLKGFIPSGFELSSEERDTNVEILGNTDATVLNLSQADLQITIKSYVIPEINEEELKESLVGTSLSEAEKILGKVRNIKTYEINVDPKVPLLQKLPGNIENISLKIRRE